MRLNIGLEKESRFKCSDWTRFCHYINGDMNAKVLGGDIRNIATVII